MRTSIQNTFLFLLMTSTSTIASPIKTQPSILAADISGLSVHQVMDVANEPPSKAAAAAPAGAKSTGTATSCSPEVQALAEGISANIADQRNEQAAVTAMGYILQESPLNTSMFDAAKSSLMDFVSKGIAIREKNQKITPEGNAATAGLAKVAMAQQEEFNLTMSLSASNVAASNATVEKLKADFAGGIMQNMKNLAAATEGCKMPSTAAAPGTGTEAGTGAKAGEAGTGAKAGEAGTGTEAGAGAKAGEAGAKAGEAGAGTEAGAGAAAPAKAGAGAGAKAGEAGSEAAPAMQMQERKRWM
ncbi:hypothetical protein MFRU_004g04720 [Monilinia fructicola]|nr:hypothetical protein MFRU_004g04720 [Monilinia fructicola]